MVEVTQADRSAAAAYWKVSRIGNGETQRRYLAGESDQSYIVQAFAAHRLAARAELLAELSEPTEAMVAISEPDMSGGFEGDVWFGHPEKRTLGTHVWRAGTWHRLPSEIEAVLSLLAKARKQRDTAIEGLVLAASALERGTHQDFQDEARAEITAMIAKSGE